MDSINDIISSLSADDIQMLKNVAGSILGSAQDTQDLGVPTAMMSSLNQNSQPNSTNNQATSALNSIGNLGLSMDDMNMILKAKGIFEKMNSTKSKNADLILALKPHLSQNSQNKADQAIKMLQLFEILPLIKELM